MAAKAKRKNPRIEKICARCSGLAEHGTVRTDEGFRPLPYCVSCEAARKAAYYVKAHMENGSAKQKLREARRRYERTAKGRARRRRYVHTERGKAAAARVYHSPAGQRRCAWLDIRQQRACRAVKEAIKREEIKPPRNCQRCGGPPTPHRRNRRGLVANHYRGYERENWLDIEWICVPCHKRGRGAYADGRRPEPEKYLPYVCKHNTPRNRDL